MITFQDGVGGPNSMGIFPFICFTSMRTHHHYFYEVEEKSFFEWLVNSVRVPEPVCGVFIPPSVVQQAMWSESRRNATDDTSGLYGISPDAGAVVAIRCGELSTIVNALFAFPPLSPGIDVYQGGRILAGYTYNDHAECANGLSEAMHAFLAYQDRFSNDKPVNHSDETCSVIRIIVIVINMFRSANTTKFKELPLSGRYSDKRSWYNYFQGRHAIDAC